MATPEATPQTPIERQRSAVSWGVATAIVLVLALYFGAQFIAAIMLSAFPLLFGWSESRTSAWIESSLYAQFIYMALFYVLVATGLFVFLQMKKFKLAWLGVVKPKLRDLGYILAAYPLYFVSFLMILLVASLLVPGINNGQEQQLGFDNPSAGLELALTFIALVVLAPLIEELLMRGFLYTSLRKHLNFVGAVLMTSLIFAAPHLQIGTGNPLVYVAAIDTFVLSLYLCWLREKTGSLWAGVLLHALKNGIAFFARFVF